LLMMFSFTIIATESISSIAISWLEKNVKLVSISKEIKFILLCCILVIRLIAKDSMFKCIRSVFVANAAKAF